MRPCAQVLALALAGLVAAQPDSPLPKPRPNRPELSSADRAALAKRLCEAIDRGSVDETLAALAARANPNVGMGAGQDSTKDRTPLIHAVVAKQVKLVDVLIAAGARLDGGDAAGHTPLMYAALTGNLAMAEHLLQLGARPDTTDDADNHADAYVKDSAPLRDLLVRAGELQSALLEALARDDVAAARRALADGARPNANDGSSSALLWAVRKGDATWIEELLRAGCRADLLHVGSLSLNSPLALAAEIADLAILRTLLAAGRPNRVALDDALAAAAGSQSADRPARVRLLLDAGADPSGAGNLLRTPALPAAATLGDFDTMRLLLAAGADQDSADQALIRAAGIGDSARANAVANALLAAGARSTSFLYQSALGNAVEHGHTELATKLLAASDDETLNVAVIEVAKSGDHRQLEWLCQAGGQRIDYTFGDGLIDPALITAIGEGHVDCVRVLLAAGANPELPPSVTHEAPLLEAIGKGQTAIVPLLLGAGADPRKVHEAPLRGKRSALDAAREAGNAEVLALLEQHMEKLGPDSLESLLKRAKLEFTELQRFYKLSFTNDETKRQQLVYVRRNAASWETLTVHEIYSLCWQSTEPPPRALLDSAFQKRFALGGLVLEQPSDDQKFWRIRFRCEAPADVTPERLSTYLQVVQSTADQLERELNPNAEDRL